MIRDLPGKSEEVGRLTVGVGGKDSFLEIRCSIFILDIAPVLDVDLSAGGTCADDDSSILLVDNLGSLTRIVYSKLPLHLPT